MKKLLIAVLLLITSGCLTHKPVTIYVPVEKKVLVPVGQCNMGELTRQLEALVVEETPIDLSTVATEDRVKVLCELAARSNRLYVALQQLLETFKQNEIDCNAKLEGLSLQ